MIIYVNMKSDFLRHNPVEIRLNRKFKEFSAYYGIVPKACKPHRLQSKGKIENVVGNLNKNFLQRTSTYLGIK